MNVRELRKNNPFKLGDKVRIGTGVDVFEIIRLGYCGPTPLNTPMFWGNTMQLTNSGEFIGLRVPGIDNRLFNIHASFVNLVEE